MRDQLDLELDSSRDAPLYRQVVDQIKARIRSGALPAGYRLPPTRDLARHLRTHRNTVVRAYEELAATGHTTSTVGRGTFVAEPPAEKKTAAPRARAPLPWESLVSQRTRLEPIQRAARLRREATRADTIDMAGQQPAAELMPNETLRRCIDHVLREKGPKCLGYVQGQGLLELRTEIAKDLAEIGVPATADDVVVTTGSQQAIDLLARVLVDPGDTFLVEASSSPGTLSLLSAAGARIVGVPRDDDGPELGELRRLARGGPKGFYMMPNHHNPTGTSISARRREALVQWSHEAGVPLIEDDYDACLNLDGQPSPPRLRAMDSEVVHVGTYSKRLIPALRVGYLVCPRPLAERVVALKTDQDLGTSGLLQHALAEFLSRGYMRAHMAKSVKEYRARRDALEAGLKASLPPEITWKHAPRGLFLWLPLPQGVSAEAVFEEARRLGALVIPGAMFRVSEREEPGLRVCFCRETPARLTEGAKRLAQAIRAVMAERRKDGSREQGIVA
jgi:DNA-binding transcriptional MocR family regulator